jgi:hypothetical protein
MDMVCAFLNELTLAAHWLNGHSRAVMAITPRSLCENHSGYARGVTAITDVGYTEDARGAPMDSRKS